MRKPWLPPVLIVIAVVLQLAVLDGLRLPGGGVPDLVLVLVAALAVAQGPVAGLITGFAAGLCLDLAPPGSALIGQYALVFCLAGWAAGRLIGRADWSPLRSVLLMGMVVAAAETASAALGLALVPAEVTLAEIRAVLPASIAYDLLLCPLVLSLVVLASGMPASTLAAGTLGGTLAAAARARRAAEHRPRPRQPRPGTLGGTLAAAARARRAAERRPRPRQPRLREATARAGDGWLGGPRGHHGTRPLTRPGARLRAANGVPGSASGLARHPGRTGRAASAPVKLRMATGRRGDGAIGNAVGIGNTGGAGLRPHWQPSRHPGLLAGESRFRPRGGEPGGSAARPYGTARAPGGPPTIRFGGHRGDAGVGRTLGSSWLATPGRPISSGPRLGSGWLAASSHPASTGPRLRMGARRSSITAGRSAAAVPTVQFRSAAPPVTRRPAAVPRFRRKSEAPPKAGRAAVPRFRRKSEAPPKPRRAAVPRFRRKSEAPPVTRRPAAVPRFRGKSEAPPVTRRPAAVPRFRGKNSRLGPSTAASGLMSGGVLDASTFRAVRRRAGSPRLRLASRGPATGMLGGSPGSALRRPPRRVRKQPRFGYGKRSLLSFPAVRRIGGRWLARKRAGSRSGTWLLGRRTGGLR